MKSLLILISGLLVGLSSWAGVRDIGNGGNVVVCYNAKKKITSIELFDYYEARTKRNLKIDLGRPSLSVDQKVDLLLSRMHRLNPNREKLYRDWYADFFKEAYIAKGVILVPLPDVGVGVIPKNCEIKQVAGQQDPVYPGDFRYTINGDLWEMMSNDNKAGLIVHELILREATSSPNDHATSAATRYLHGQIASDSVKSMNLREYINLLLLVKFTAGDAGTVLIPLSPRQPITFYNDDMVESAPGLEFDKISPCRNIYWQNHVFPYMYKGHDLNYCNLTTQTEFFPNGQLKRITSSYGKRNKNIFLKNATYEALVEIEAIDFYENGEAAAIRLPSQEKGTCEDPKYRNRVKRRLSIFLP